MDYQFIMDPSDDLSDKGINVAQFRNSGILAGSRGNIQTHTPYDMQYSPQQQSSPPQMIPQQQFISPTILSCREVFDHVEDCPVCSGHFKKDRFYLIIIIILILIIFYLMNKHR